MGRLTAERFVGHPFDTHTASRLYRTAIVRDGGRRQPEFLGRADIRSSRGFRIEPAELESALLAHAAVRETIAVARRDSRSGEPQLIAYVAAADRAADRLVAVGRRVPGLRRIALFRDDV